MDNMHQTQVGILKQLLFGENLRYTDLKIDPDIENNTFQFHLDKLVDGGYVQKAKTGYSLTLEGKKVATHIDTDEQKFVRRKKITVHLYCLRERAETELLCYTRLKQPFFGNQGVPVGKVKYGEKFTNAAKRELKEETSLIGEPTLFKIIHYLVVDRESKDILDDKLFLDFFVKEPTGELRNSKEGEYYWLAVSEIPNRIKKPFNDVETYLKGVKQVKDYNGEVLFEEIEHLTSEF